jgi:RNA 2',3'-cyclic 3'-phosphodiesterase
MFVALDLPDEARARLAAWRDELVGGRGDLRPVAPAALHVTLVFLGWQDESAASAIADAAWADAGGIAAPVLRAGGLRPLPPRNPRLFALELDDEEGRASALQAAISDALEAGGWYRPEKRPFWPHLTLARVKRGERRAAVGGGTPPPNQPLPPAQPALYRSTLRPQGALYEPLGRTALR